MKFKHVSTAILASSIMLVATLALANTTEVTLISPNIKITQGTALKIIAPQSGSYKETDTIYVSAQATSVSGSLYMYLFDPITKKVVATAGFDRNALSSSIPQTISFNLAKSRASSHILPGNYKIALCDIWGAGRYSICTQTLGTITIVGSAPVITSVTPEAISGASTITLTGSGFTNDSYVLIDGGWNSLATLKVNGYDNATLTIMPGLSSGPHYISIGTRGGIFPLSNSAIFTILAPTTPSISSITKSGSVYTATGTGFSKYFPSKVEVLQGSRVLRTTNPAAVNSYAISSDGKSMKFVLDGEILVQGNISVRIVNSDSHKSNVVSIL